MAAPHPRRLVALRLRPGPDLARALRAVWQDGNAALPLDPDAPEDARAATLEALRPHALVDDRGQRPLRGGEDVADGTALVLATSGTTGRPKGVVLSHRALQASADATSRRLRLERGTRWVCCLPVHHVAGVMVLARAWRSGTEPIILPRFSVAGVEAAPAGAISLVPTMLARLLDADADLARFRAILLGGAPAPADLLERARAAGARITVTYGMTETCGGCVYDGRPLDAVAVAVREDGRIALRGAVLFDGYRGEAGATPAAPAGDWFTTQDLGRFDDDGRLEVLGRADDVILSGGEQVAPAAVEAVLLDHPAVADVAVVGRDDPEWGEIAVAVVVPAGAPPTLEALRAFVRQRAERALAPRALAVVETLPRLSSGKPDRAALRRAYGGTDSSIPA
jgi:o-succinylbenzoate---CoA ligase